jgi:hypothetical protein
MSSSEQDRIRELAERVARRLSGEPGPGDAGAGRDGGGELASVRESLSQIQRRLSHIESHLVGGERDAHDATSARRADDARTPSAAPPPATPTRSMWLSGTYVPAVSHPSQEQFTGIGEAVSELVEFFEREKTCNVEPGAKPCDHCGMCSSRGF